MGHDCCAGAPCRLAQPAHIEPGMDRGGIGQPGAGNEERCPHLLGDGGAVEDLEILAEQLLLECKLAQEPLLLAFRVGQDQPAAPIEMAFDALPFDELVNRPVGRFRLAIEGDAEVLAQRVDNLAQRVLEGLADEADVAAARTVAQRLGIDHQCGAAGPGSFERGAEAAVAGADDENIDARGQIARRSLRRCGPPPVRRLRIVGSKDIADGTHAPEPKSSVSTASSAATISSISAAEMTSGGLIWIWSPSSP